MSWRDILNALDLKNNAESQRHVRELNEKYEGPIILPGKGGQPKVSKVKLLAWWNHLEILWQTSGAGKNLAATLEHQYHFGRDETVLPDLSGHVKKRRK
jgi:hypothetical protein